MMSKIAKSKRMNNYCGNMLKLFNYGQISLPM